MSKEKYYNFQDILKFLDFDYEFNKADKIYPFNRGKENVGFSWARLLYLSTEYGIW